ncbi:MAG: carbohydrate kinase family protein [bacterium]|nr:carbohydrate kinase family protein [bacterium]
MHRPFDALAVGSIYLDIHYGMFPFDSKVGITTETETVGSQVLLTVGGSAANFAQIAASLGLQTALLGKIGQDRVGDIVTEELGKLKIQQLIFTDPGVRTNVSSHFTNPSGRTIQTTGGSANAALNPEDVFRVIRNYFDKISTLYIGSYFKLTALQAGYYDLVKDALAAGIEVLLDHGMISNVVEKSHIEKVQKMIEQVTYYRPNENEFKTIWDVDSIEAGFKKLQQLSTRPETVVTRGGEGAIGLDQSGNVYDVPSFSITPKNAVGAGDSFNAGYLYARKSGKEMLESIQFAHAVAAVRISESPLPTIEQVTSMLGAKNV